MERRQSWVRKMLNAANLGWVAAYSLRKEKARKEGCWSRSPPARPRGGLAAAGSPAGRSLTPRLPPTAGADSGNHPLLQGQSQAAVSSLSGTRWKVRAATGGHGPSPQPGASPPRWAPQPPLPHPENQGEARCGRPGPRGPRAEGTCGATESRRATCQLPAPSRARRGCWRAALHTKCRNPKKEITLGWERPFCARLMVVCWLGLFTLLPGQACPPRRRSSGSSGAVRRSWRIPAPAADGGRRERELPGWLGEH